MATSPAVEPRYTPSMQSDHIVLAEQLLEIVERAQTFTGATGALIAIKRGEELVVRTSNGIAPDVGASFAIHIFTVGTCVRTGKPQNCVGADAETKIEPILRALGVRSVAAVPLHYDGAVRGVLAVMSQMPDSFQRVHIAMLMTLKDAVANNLRRCEIPMDSLATSGPSAAPQAPARASVSPIVTSAPTVPLKPVTATPAAAPVPQATTITRRPPIVEQPVLPAARAESLPPVSEPAAHTANSVVEQPPTASAVTSHSSEAKKPSMFELIQAPASAPVDPSPDLLCPGDDPSRYGSVCKTISIIPSDFRDPEPVPLSALMNTHEVSTGWDWQPIAKWVAVGSLAVIALGGWVLYPRKTNVDATSTTAAKAEFSPPVIPLQPETPAVAAQKPAEMPQVKPKPAQTATAASSKATPEPATEEQVAEPAMQLAAAKPLPKVENEAVEAPALTLPTGGASVLPSLPSPTAPSANLAAKKSAVVPAAVLQSTAPRYPENAKHLGVQGTVKLEVVISPDGKVGNVKVVAGDPLLRQASIAAVRQWQYRPATLDGKPVQSTAEITLKFTPGR